MAQIDDLPPLRDVIARHGLSARKALGQNFLLDLNLTSRIARSSGPLEGVTVIEIGPGPGGLTRALLANGAKKVIAIEMDERCLPALAEISDYYPGRLEVIQGDALKLDQAALAGKNTPVRVVANLPYNVAAPLIIAWLKTDPWPPWWQSVTVMVQREFADRLVATTQNPKDYGRLTILTSLRAEAYHVFDVAPTAFVPQPKVMSSVVHLVPRAQPLPCAIRTLEIITQAAFGQRRKMLRAALKSLGDPLQLLEAAGVRPEARAEEIELEGFVRLSQALDARSQKSLAQPTL